jgi:hypothetical protein
VCFFRTVRKTSRARRGRVGKFLLAFFFGCCSSALAADWQATVSKEPPGKFPELRPFRAIYNFGWSGFTAGTGEAHFTKPSEQRFELQGTGRTIGLVRALWRFDVNLRAVADARTLRPIEANQIETVRSKKIATHLAFTSNDVTRSRTEGAGAGTTKSKQFSFPNLLDLHAAMLYLRSQPLRDRNAHRLVVYPATNAYLATITVIGHEKISVHAGTYNAIKLDLQLNKVGKNLGLEPHKKFRRAIVWVSDDADRLILRIEAQIFVGSVFAELQSVHFDNTNG